MVDTLQIDLHPHVTDLARLTYWKNLVHWLFRSDGSNTAKGAKHRIHISARIANSDNQIVEPFLYIVS